MTSFHFQAPICNLNLCLQPDITPETAELPEGRVADFQTNIRTIREAGYGKFDTIHKADLKISDIGNLLGSDWVKLAHELEIPDSDINIIKTEYPENEGMYSSRFRISVLDSYYSGLHNSPPFADFST